MKQAVFTILLFLFSTILFGQNSTWLFDKKVKTVSFLGSGILDYDSKNRELVPDPASESNRIVKKIDTVLVKKSEIVEFENSYNKFILDFFKRDKIVLRSVKMYNPIEYNLSFETVRDMPSDQYFVYSGQSADSVELVFSRKKTVDIDIDSAYRTILSTLNVAGIKTDSISKLIPITNSSFNHQDSLYYKTMLRDPNSLFRVQVFKKKSTSFEPENYFLYFPPLDGDDKNNVPDESILTYASAISETHPETPRYTKSIKKKNRKYFALIVDKDANNDLKLGVKYKDGGDKFYWFTKRTEGSKIFWAGEPLVYSFPGYSNVRKLVYCKIYAEQTGPNTVKITNKISTNGGNKARVTYMTYPEIGIKYLK